MFAAGYLRKLCSPKNRRRAGVATFLGAYLLAAVGFPLELPTSVDTSTPFACQDHRCGCTSAEQCWRSCCCFTHEQKLAWAKAHGVAVPTHLMSEQLADGHRSNQHKSDLRAPSGPHATCGRCSSAKSRGESTTSVAMIDVLKCRGLTTMWCSVGAVAPPPPAVNWEFDWTCQGQLLGDRPQLDALGDAPPTPPPRV